MSIGMVDTGVRVDTGVCPYGGGVDGDDAMDVVGHYLKCIDTDPGIMYRDIIPNRLNHPAGIVQHYFRVYNVSEYTNTVLGTQGDKIRPGL
jgi:hypothetical protein|tara:strand:- start:508 stop:780 length:273 start_codon:yes stop_codon:yes gene_type:complete